MPKHLGDSGSILFAMTSCVPHSYPQISDAEAQSFLRAFPGAWWIEDASGSIIDASEMDAAGFRSSPTAVVVRGDGVWNITRFQCGSFNAGLASRLPS